MVAAAQDCQWKLIDMLNLVSISTADQNSWNSGAVRRLIESGLSVHSLKFILVMRDCTQEVQGALQEYANVFHIIETGQLSASAARNTGLKFLLKSGILEDTDFVGFIDDDAVVSSEFESWVTQANRSPDLIFGSYGPSFKSRKLSRFPDFAHVDKKFVIDSTGTSTTWVRPALLEKAGLFDERLGPGTRYPMGEDVDFALRCLYLAHEPAYSPNAFVEHPYKTRARAETISSDIALSYAHARFLDPSSIRLMKCLLRSALLLARKAKLGSPDLGNGVLSAILLGHAMRQSEARQQRRGRDL